jgi:hypothetical protein
MPDETPPDAPEELNPEPEYTPHEITDRGYFFAKSASFAVLPSPIVERVIRNGKVKQTKDDLWLFEQTARINTDNLVMRIRPRSPSWFETMTPYAHPDEFTNLRLAARDVENVTPVASTYRRLSRIYGWPTLLYVWTDEESIFIRRAFTEEVWERMDINQVATRAYVCAHKELFGLPTFPG